MREPVAQDEPETPGHIFAFRAFKTALFGTPVAGYDNSTLISDERPIDDIPEDQKLFSLSNDALVKPVASSPIKSILVTPGTIAPFRKTVTFSGVHKNSGTGVQNNLEGGGQNAVPLVFDDLAVRKEDLRRSLFQASTVHKCEDVSKSELTKHDGIKAPPIHKATILTPPIDASPSALNNDVTLDLKSPKSISGQHWKQAYQREHDKTKTEMKRLIKYSQAAKSFAAKRDNEATRMREKLEEAETKVLQLEERVTQLAHELGSVAFEDDAHARLMDDLAVQTTNAVKYKQRAEKYRAALESESRKTCEHSDHHAHPLSQHGRGKESGKKPGALVNNDDDHIALIKQENASLKATIGRVKEEMLRYESRHRDWQENRRRRDERWALQRKDLERQLARREEENHRLQREITTLKEQIATKDTNPSGTSTRDAPSFQEERPKRKPTKSEGPLETRPAPSASRSKALDPRSTGRNCPSRLEQEKSLSNPTGLTSIDRSTSRPHSHTPAYATWDTVKTSERAHSDTNGPRCLARNSGNNMRKDPLQELTLEAVPSGSLHYSARDSNITPLTNDLWNNLKRRTSLSLVDNLSVSQSRKGNRVAGTISGSKSNVVLASSREDVGLITVVGKENVEPGG